MNQAIGVFDSGYGGLTVLKEMVKELPEYDYLYFGDNARAPYGTRSFDTIYIYTLECVEYLFRQGCHLVILACNTASAKALRNIQQLNLLKMDANKRVLGVIRPTTEVIGKFSKTNEIGILGTNGTVNSGSYGIEINKFFPEVKAFQQPCPMWVSLIENGEHETDGADYFIKKDLNQLLAQSSGIDTILLACTHYPLISASLKSLLPANIKLIEQGQIVAKSLKNYLKQHPEIEKNCSKAGKRIFHTSGDSKMFEENARRFFGEKVSAEKITL